MMVFCTTRGDILSTVTLPGAKLGAFVLPAEAAARLLSAAVRGVHAIAFPVAVQYNDCRAVDCVQAFQILCDDAVSRSVTPPRTRSATTSTTIQ